MIKFVKTRTFNSFHTYFSPCNLQINPLSAELNPICYLLALLAHHFLHVSRIGVKSLTLRLLMPYIYIYIYIYIYMYMERLFLMFLEHTQQCSTVGRTPLDEWSARPEESYRLCCVVVCVLETSRIGAPYIYIYMYDISRLRVNTTTGCGLACLLVTGLTHAELK
jgi:hypothetical protein